MGVVAQQVGGVLKAEDELFPGVTEVAEGVVGVAPADAGVQERAGRGVEDRAEVEPRGGE